MRKIPTLLTAAFIFIPTLSFGYIGLDFGAVDKSNFGYGLSFGGGLPLNFGIDGQLIGFYKNDNASSAFIQGNVDLTYDVGGLLKLGPLHPYAKAGFTYAALYFDGGLGDWNAGHGPGFNFGAGLDFKVLPFMTIGVDMTEAIVKMSGVTIQGIPITPDQTDKVFNILGVIKFGAY